MIVEVLTWVTVVAFAVAGYYGFEKLKAMIKEIYYKFDTIYYMLCDIFKKKHDRSFKKRGKK